LNIENSGDKLLEPYLETSLGYFDSIDVQQKAHHLTLNGDLVKIPKGENLTTIVSTVDNYALNCWVPDRNGSDLYLQYRFNQNEYKLIKLDKEIEKSLINIRKQLSTVPPECQ
jgi:hypothetical protein